MPPRPPTSLIPHPSSFKSRFFPIETLHPSVDIRAHPSARSRLGPVFKTHHRARSFEPPTSDIDPSACCSYLIPDIRHQLNWEANSRLRWWGAGG
eukprot:1756370-Rhodomonas_salina.1